jgi:hypothetical protein
LFKPQQMVAGRPSWFVPAGALNVADQIVKPTGFHGFTPSSIRPSEQLRALRAALGIASRWTPVAPKPGCWALIAAATNSIRRRRRMIVIVAEVVAQIKA